MEKQIKTRSYSDEVLRVIETSWFFHPVLWIGVLLILTGLISINGSWPFSFYLLNMLVALPAMMLFAYVMDALGNRMLFGNHQAVLFLFLLFVFTIVCALLIPVLNHFIFFGLFYPRVFEPVPWFNWRMIPQNVILLWFPYFVLSIKTFFLNWFKSEQEKLIIENKQLLSEIQLMKIKLHPHFLFNTLNNLYVMSTLNNANAAEYIMKLSELYRIMLYECNKDFYPLQEELKLIDNYIELEKIRYDERLKIDIQLPEEINEQIILPPLLLFTFVENAFKHGCRNDVGKPFIKVTVKTEEGQIHFKAENSIPESEYIKSKFGGIGLDNTQKRLDLIYKDEYVFSNGISDGCYRVYLKIPQLTMSSNEALKT